MTAATGDAIGRLSRVLIVAIAIALATVSIKAQAQDLEPRAFANTPVGLNFLIGGYAYTTGKVGTDPSVPLQDTDATLNGAVLAYVRTLDLGGRSGKLDIVLPYAWASGSGEFAGQEMERDTSGLGDPRLRFSMLFYGGPALTLEEFRDFKADVIVGASFQITVPVGEYDSDKLLNIGTNRWSFKPEVGVSKTLGPLTLEMASGVRFFTDNTDFLGGRTLELSPIYSVQGHLIYSLTPGLWLGLDGLYYTGGRTTIDGAEGERQENVRVGLTGTMPVNRYSSVTIYGSTSVYSKTGGDYDVVGIALQFRWGAGL